MLSCTLAQLRPLSSIWMHGDVLAIQLVWHTLVSHVSSTPISVSSSISCPPPPPMHVRCYPVHPPAPQRGEGGMGSRDRIPPTYETRGSHRWNERGIDTQDASASLDETRGERYVDVESRVAPASDPSHRHARWWRWRGAVEPRDATS